MPDNNEYGYDIPDIRELLDSLGFSLEPGDLEEAIVNQPTLLLKAERLRAERADKAKRFEVVLNNLRTDKALALRREYADAGEKTTEKLLEQQVEQDPTVRQAVKAYNQAKSLEDWLKAVVAVYHERGWMIKGAIQLRSAAASMDSKTVQAELERMGVQNLRDKAKKSFPGRET